MPDQKNNKGNQNEKRVIANSGGILNSRNVRWDLPVADIIFKILKWEVVICIK